MPAPVSTTLPENRLTPTWLSIVCALAGQQPPDLSRPFRYLLAGCVDGALAVEVAAAHPRSEVWAWDSRPSAIEATRRLATERELANIVVHERPEPPALSQGGLADFIVLRDVLDTVSDRVRGQVMAMVGSGVRPGGLVCVSYRTTVGHTEYLPVITTIRYIARRHPAGAVVGVADALALLERMREGGAGYLTTRPRVAQWFDELLASDPATVAERYVMDELRPLSHATVNEWMQELGCSYVGSTRPADELDLDIPGGLREMIATAGSPVLREVYRDLAVRREHRCEVYRLGECAMSADASVAALEELGVAVAGRSLDDVRRTLEASDVA